MWENIELQNGKTRRLPMNQKSKSLEFSEMQPHILNWQVHIDFTLFKSKKELLTSPLGFQIPFGCSNNNKKLILLPVTPYIQPIRDSCYFWLQKCTSNSLAPLQFNCHLFNPTDQHLLFKKPLSSSYCWPCAIIQIMLLSCCAWKLSMFRYL